MTYIYSSFFNIFWKFTSNNAKSNSLFVIYFESIQYCHAEFYMVLSDKDKYAIFKSLY